MGKTIVCGGGRASAPEGLPTASLTAKSGVTYTDGIADLDAATISSIGAAISNCSDITNETSTVYVDGSTLHRQISIGDQITIPLNGVSYAFDVIGFNHDPLTDSTAYGSETETAKAGMTLQLHHCFSTEYPMNTLNTNIGGWGASLMRTSTMEIMKGYFPEEWKAVIKLVDKIGTLGDEETTSSPVVFETVSDACFLLAEIEIFGSTTYSAPGEGTQYAYYEAGNPTEKVWYNSNGYEVAYVWSERSTWKQSSSCFCYVGSTGKKDYGFADNDRGVAFAFCV